MNNTITSLLYSNNKYKKIPVFNTLQNLSTDNETKYNYSNHLNQIESIKNPLNTNSNLPTENNSLVKYISHSVQKGKPIPSIKHLRITRKQKYYNNINILQFNTDICSKTINTNFTGKKILLSKYPLMTLNKIAENEDNKGKDKTVEINSTFLDKNGLGFNNIIKGEYLTKIEKELNAILNKTKQNKTQSINKSQNSLFNHNNESKIRINYDNYFLKENKTTNNDNTTNIINKSIHRKELFNQYLNSNMIKRKVLFIDKYNHTISNDNTITLLGDEKDMLYDKYFLNKTEKSNEVNLPLLHQYNKAADKNAKFLTEFPEKKTKSNNTENTKAQSSSLSQLIKNRFAKQNYKNQKISGMSHVYDHYNPNNPNLIKSEKKPEETLDNLTMNFYKNNKKDASTNTRRKRRRTTKFSAMNDILGVIKAKTIGAKKNNKNKKKQNPSKDKENPNKKKKKKLKRVLSQLNPVSSIYRISRRFSLDKEKEIKSLINIPLQVKNARGRKIKVTLIKKENRIIPINAKGHQIKDGKTLDNLYEEVKSRLNTQKHKQLLHKRRSSINPINTFNNPIIAISQEGKESNSDLSKSDIDIINDIKNNVLNNSLMTTTKAEEKENNQTKTKSQLTKRRSSVFNDSNKSPKNQEEKQNKSKGLKEVKIKEDSFYKEEDDFIKDFNFEFYSSEDEGNDISFPKLMRLVRKKINKYLFQIFEFIAKNADIDKDFKKEDLTKYLIDKDFRNFFRLLKEQIIKLRELVRDSLDPEGKDKKKKIYIKDIEIINYIYRYIKDKNSLFYKSIYKRIKAEKEEEKRLNNNDNYDKLFEMLKNKGKEGFRKKVFSLYSKRDKDFSEDKDIKQRSNSKKFVKKKKAQKDLEFISQDEKKTLLLNEINLTNEIRYQISISHDKESKEKFKILLNKIEALRNLTGDEYVKSLKKNFTMFKDEADEILKAKEIEERLNGFIDDLNYQRNTLKDKHKFIMSLMNIKDNKFLTSFENEVSE